jgi:hypothetical protein
LVKGKVSGWPKFASYLVVSGSRTAISTRGGFAHPPFHQRHGKSAFVIERIQVYTQAPGVVARAARRQAGD